MRYRIEQSRTRQGFAQVHLPGRVIALEAAERVGPVWRVALTDLGKADLGKADLGKERSGTIAVRANNASDAVWRVARAAVRAVSEATGSPIEGEFSADSDADAEPSFSNLP